MLPEAADAGRLRDMIAFGEEAISLTGTLDAAQFVADRRTFLAVSRCVEILGEAGWKLSDSMKSRRMEIAWPLILNAAFKSSREGAKNTDFSYSTNDIAGSPIR